MLGVCDEFAMRWINYTEVVRDALWDVLQRQVGVGRRVASNEEGAA